MEQKSKSMQPYKSITSEVKDGMLFLDLEAVRVEETIRFAYSLHISLLSVVHAIIVYHDGKCVSKFVVYTPNHGE